MTFKHRLTKWMVACGIPPLVDTRFTVDDKFKSLEAKAERLVEEAQEILDACKAKDGKELLDGYADVKFVLEQFAIELEHYNFQTYSAITAVMDNNELKYSVSYDFMIREQAKLTLQDGAKLYYVDTNEYEGELHYCLKRFTDGKISKYVDFPKVDLSGYVPMEFKLQSRISQ